MPTVSTSRNPIGNLVLGRKFGEAIMIGEGIAVVLVAPQRGGDDARLLIIAPKDIAIVRTEESIDALNQRVRRAKGAVA